LLGADFLSRLAHRDIHSNVLAVAASVTVTVVGWVAATLLLALSFAVIYRWAPSVKTRRWQWLTPGGAFGIGGWLSRVPRLPRLHPLLSHVYSVTYGSLGAVIILLTWFYISGLMLLVGAEINSEIECAAAEIRLSGLPKSSIAKETDEESPATGKTKS
jgi:membrane protein